MAPREVIVETDQHRRQAVQRRAHDVEAARDRQMRQIQALGAAPRKMWIAPQQRHAGAGGVLAERIHVAGETAMRRSEEQKTELQSPTRTPDAVVGITKKN